MLPFVSEDLAARMQYVVAMGSDAMDVVAGFAEPAVAVWAGLIFHVFLKSVF